MQFPAAYRCSISSRVLPEIDGVRVGLAQKDWKVINCLLFFFFLLFCRAGQRYHEALWARWNHNLSWAPPVFYDRWMVEGGHWKHWQCFTPLLSQPHCSITLLLIRLLSLISLCYFDSTLSLVTAFFPPYYGILSNRFSFCSHPL